MGQNKLHHDLATTLPFHMPMLHSLVLFCYRHCSWMQTIDDWSQIIHRKNHWKRGEDQNDPSPDVVRAYFDGATLNWMASSYRIPEVGGAKEPAWTLCKDGASLLSYFLLSIFTIQSFTVMTWSMVTEARPPVSLLSKPVPVVAWWMLSWDGSHRLVILDIGIFAKWSDEGFYWSHHSSRKSKHMRVMLKARMRCWQLASLAKIPISRSGVSEGMDLMRIMS